MEKESTPLLSNAKGGGHLNKNPIINASGIGEGPTRRRNGQQNEHNAQHFGAQLDTKHAHIPIASQSTNSNKNYHDNDNEHSKKKQNNNRTMFQKLSASATLLKEVVVPISRNTGNGSGSGSGDHINVLRNGISAFSVDSRGDHIIYYEDNYNDLPWKCSFGTSENDGIWMNKTDGSGMIMGSMVWIMILYSGFTVTILAQNNTLNSMVAIIYCTICALALSSHAKTVFTDPGGVPKSAVPTEEDELNRVEFPMCSACETYKPKHCHHCRICDRCISGMDHHCPWMNNCIGRGNMKHFILFLVYVWLASAYALSLFTLNYFLCNNDEECTFPEVLVHLVRIMTVLCCLAFSFTSSMIMSVSWSIHTGLGTIDRMKREETGGITDDEEITPIPLRDIFGIEHYHTWFFPIDPVFEDYDRIMGFSTVPRLQREKKFDGNSNPTTKLGKEQV